MVFEVELDTDSDLHTEQAFRRYGLSTEIAAGFALAKTFRLDTDPDLLVSGFPLEFTPYLIRGRE